MNIYRSIDAIPPCSRRTVVTIGNFDGVHLGHREIFRKVRRSADSLGADSVVITFVPHPLKVVPNPGKQILLINTYAEKETLIEASGVDALLVIPFNMEFASLQAREFVSEILVNRLCVAKLIIGYNYSFGRGRQGNVATLVELAQEFGFELEVLQPIGHDGLVYSSTEVRKLLLDGNVAGVVPLLGRHFSLGGIVVSGHNRGASLGFPTANIRTEKELIPGSGVYAVKVKLDDAHYDAACNIGDNPTFGNTESSIEVYLFDFAGNLYGREIRIYFVARIRGEKRFGSVDELKHAIAADVAQCRDILGKTQIIEYREYLEGRQDADQQI